MSRTTRVEWVVAALVVLLCAVGISQHGKVNAGDGVPSLVHGQADSKNAWVSYTSEDGGYSVEMPGKAEKMTQKVPTELGELEMTMAIYEASAEEVYLSAFTDFPGEKVTDAVEVKKVLQDTRDGMITGPNAKKIAEREIELDGHAGLEFDVSLATVMQQKARIYMVDNRLYQLIAIYPKGKENEKKAQRFVESFKFDK